MLQVIFVNSRCFLLCQTHIALTTIVVILLTKVIEEHAATTSVGGSDVTGYLVDALLEVCLAILIDHRRQTDELRIHTGNGIAHRRRLAMRNEVDDAIVMQVLENMIDVFRLQTRKMGQERLFDIDEVSKDA